MLHTLWFWNSLTAFSRHWAPSIRCAFISASVLALSLPTAVVFPDPGEVDSVTEVATPVVPYEDPDESVTAAASER